MNKGMWLSFRRSLGLAAPADGLCAWSWTQRSVTSSYYEVRYHTRRFKCVLPWRHGNDHYAPRVEDISDGTVASESVSSEEKKR